MSALHVAGGSSSDRSDRDLSLRLKNGCVRDDAHCSRFLAGLGMTKGCRRHENGNRNDHGKMNDNGKRSQVRISKEVREAEFRRVIRAIPKGKVASYGQIAAAVGYPGRSRAVARFLKISPTGSLPWQRVVGAGGEIKLRMEAGAEQRFRLEMEGVKFSGRKVNMREHGHKFPSKQKRRS